MTTRIWRMLTRYPLYLFALAVIMSLLSPARAEGLRIDAAARPSRLVYGEGNKVTITVKVRDSQGADAPDGTAVYFHTTLGTLPVVAYTRSGQVNVLLENTTGPGLAQITVTTEDARQMLTVEFLGQGSVVEARSERLTYRLKAQRIYYSADRELFDLRDQAVFIAPGFTLTAGAIQYDVRKGILTAQYGINLSAGTAAVSAEKLRMDVSVGRGSYIQINPDVVFKNFVMPAVDGKVEDSARDVDFRPLDPVPTRTWILCREATVLPGDQIQFRRPEFYINNFERRLFSLPYHVLDLRASTAGMLFNSQISLTSSTGLSVDFPVYYAASPSHLGSLHLRSVTKGASSSSEGVQVGIEEEYLIGEKGDGALYLDDLTRPTRNVTWEHRQDFGKTEMNFNASYDRIDEKNPYTTRFGLSADHPIGSVNMYLSTNWSLFGGGDQDGVSELSAYFPAIQFGRTGIDLTISPYIGFSRAVDTPQSTADADTTNEFYQGIEFDMGLPSLRLLGGALTSNLNHQVLREDSGEMTNAFSAGVGWHRQISSLFSSSLNYTFNLSSSMDEPEQTLSLNLSGNRSRAWNLNTYATYGLNTGVFNSSGSLTYYLPWQRTRTGEPQWYLRYNGGLNVSDRTTVDQQFSLARSIGVYAIVLRYSPNGNTGVTGLGSVTGKNWAIELMRQGW